MAGPERSGAAGRQPNVLLFLLDQMRQPRWFPEHARLPGLERLKAQGVEFENHFVSAVPCSPSRACLVTGLHMDQHRVYNNMNPQEQPSLEPALPSLGRLFQEAGYQTPYFGKWHLCVGEDKKGKQALEPYGFDWLERERLAFVWPGLMFDDDHTRAAIKWLSEPGHRERPWFLVLSLTNPHDICSYPAADVPHRSNATTRYR